MSVCAQKDESGCVAREASQGLCQHTTLSQAYFTVLDIVRIWERPALEHFLLFGRYQYGLSAIGSSAGARIPLISRKVIVIRIARPGPALKSGMDIDITLDYSNTNPSY